MWKVTAMEVQKPYLLLFNAVTDALKQLEQQNVGIARELLIHAQQEAEEIFLDEDGYGRDRL